jgi:acyl-CoA synthetase (AMP-forming)/AMP-acid ligase II
MVIKAPDSSASYFVPQSNSNQLSGLMFLIHLPLYIGVESVTMAEFEIAEFCSVIQRHKITYTYVAPPIVLHLAKNAIIDSYDLRSLRMMVSGAAPLSKELIIALFKRLGIPVRQAYGLSETTSATHLQVSPSLIRTLLIYLTNFSRPGIRGKQPWDPLGRLYQTWLPCL